MPRNRPVGRPRFGKKVLSGAARVAAHAAEQRAAGKKRISVWVSKDLIDRLHNFAERQGVPISRAIEDAFENLIDKEKAR